MVRPGFMPETCALSPSPETWATVAAKLDQRTSPPSGSDESGRPAPSRNVTETWAVPPSDNVMTDGWMLSEPLACTWSSGSERSLHAETKATTRIPQSTRPAPHDSAHRDDTAPDRSEQRLEARQRPRLPAILAARPAAMDQGVFNLRCVECREDPRRGAQSRAPISDPPCCPAPVQVQEPCHGRDRRLDAPDAPVHLGLSPARVDTSGFVPVSLCCVRQP